MTLCQIIRKCSDSEAIVHCLGKFVIYRRYIQSLAKVGGGIEGDQAEEEVAVMSLSVDMAELDQRRGVDAPMESDAEDAQNRVSRRPPLRSASVGQRSASAGQRSASAGRKTVAAKYVGDEECVKKEEVGAKKEEEEHEVVIVDGSPFHLVLQKADGNCLFRSIGHSLKVISLLDRRT